MQDTLTVIADLLPQETAPETAPTAAHAKAHTGSTMTCIVGCNYSLL